MAKSAQAKSEILEAGDFTLAEARLLTSSGLDIDVKENIEIVKSNLNSV